MPVVPMIHEHLGVLFVAAACAGMATWHIFRSPREPNWKVLVIIGYAGAGVLLAHVFLPVPRAAIFAMALFLAAFAIAESPWIRTLWRR